jgi:hypothetical protein
MTGKLGSVAPAADAATTLYTVPSAHVTTANLICVNRGAAAAKVRVAITADASAGNKDWIEYDAPLPGGGGVLHLTALVCAAGEKIIVQDDTGAVSYRAHGFEEDV